MQKPWQQKRKDHVREYREKKKAMKEAYANGGKGKGKSKGKAKVTKTTEWKLAKKEYRTKRKELRKERLAAKREWRDKKAERMRARREARRGDEGVGREMVWVVVENLDG